MARRRTARVAATCASGPAVLSPARRGDELRDVGPTDAAARLFAASFPLFHDARAVAFSLAFLESVVTRVPCHELGFVPSAAVLGLLSARASS